MCYIHICDADDTTLMSNLKGSMITDFKIAFIIWGRGSLGRNQDLQPAKHALCY